VEKRSSASAYVYGSAHADVFDAREWFDHFVGVYTALWWIPSAISSSVDEAKKRLAHLHVHGPSQFACFSSPCSNQIERLETG